MSDAATSRESWPEAPHAHWLETCATLQMWLQMVGKVRLARAPRENHWWHVALYLTPRGFGTSPMPDGARSFSIEFDFIDHRLVIGTSDNRREEMKLSARPIADFYAEFMGRLAALGIDVTIRPVPSEVVEAIPFPENHKPAVYRPDVAERVWRILAIADMALKRFRGDFLGKSSPVHLFWGAFDLALTRFSGRPAPQHPGGIPNVPDWVMWEAYSHEVWSCGFWPGTAGSFARPAFYAYAYPTPAGFATARTRPAESFYSPTLKEYVLPYDVVRLRPDPAAAVEEFLRSTYRAAADLGAWNRAELERPPAR